MSNVLNDKELERLIELGKDIKGTLSFGDPNGHGYPSRTNRFALLEMFKEYLEIHEYTITKKISNEESKFYDIHDTMDIDKLTKEIQNGD